MLDEREAKEFLVASLISLSIVLFIVFAATPLYGLLTNV